LLSLGSALSAQVFRVPALVGYFHGDNNPTEVGTPQRLFSMNFFDYFQVTSLSIVLLIFVGRACYLRFRRNINPIAIGGGKKGILLVAELAAIIGFVVWMTMVLLFALRSSFRLFPSSLDLQVLDFFPTKIAGVALITSGVVILGSAYASFGDSWRVGFDEKNPGNLVTTGTFALSRNPIYVFLDLWFMGVFLINGTLIFLIFALLAVAVLHWQILQEEKFLVRLYGAPYRSYCAKIGRYFYW
jgi:protein-S-isoprenylcysteine O-methyltransferase Ste14